MRREVLAFAFWRGLATLFQALNLVLIARILGQEDFGLFSAGVSIGAFLGVVLGFGGTVLALRVRAEEDEGRQASNLVVLRLITLPFVVLGAAFPWWFAGNRALEFVIATLAYVCAETFCELTDAVLLGRNRRKLGQLSLLLRRFFLTCGLLLSFTVDEDLTAISIVVSSALGCMISLAFLRRIGPIRPSRVKQTFEKGRTFWAANVVGKIEITDAALASLVVASSQLGLYAGAARVTNPLNVLTVSILGIYTPKLAAADSEQERLEIFKSARRFLLQVSVALVVLSPVVGLCVDVVLGPSYEGILPIAAVLTIAVAISAASQGYIALYFARGHARMVFRARLVSAICGVAAMLVLGAFWGAIGVALGMIVLQSVQFASLLLVGRSSR